MVPDLTRNGDRIESVTCRNTICRHLLTRPSARSDCAADLFTAAIQPYFLRLPSFFIFYISLFRIFYYSFSPVSVLLVSDDHPIDSCYLGSAPTQSPWLVFQIGFPFAESAERGDLESASEQQRAGLNYLPLENYAKLLRQLAYPV